MSHYCQAGWGQKSRLLTCCPLMVMGGCCHHLVGISTPAPHSLLWHPGVGMIEVPVTAWQGWNSKLSTWPLLVRGRARLQVYFCSVWPKRVWWLPISFLPGFAVPFLVLWLERAGFPWIFFFFLCASLCFWIANFLSIWFGTYEIKIKPKNVLLWFPWVLRPPASLPSFLHLSESCVCFTCNV